jgi:hypothetical protein
MRHNMRTTCLFISSSLMLAIGLVIVFSSFQPVEALQLSTRSLDVGSSIVSANTSHTFSFTFPDNSLTGSIVFEYCTSPLAQIVCDAPSGLDVSGATLISQSGETGFIISNQDTNEITLSRTPADANNEASQYVFNNVINPDTAGDTFFVRISTYPTTDGSGAYTDFGSVANSVTNTVNINTQVPPILNFCVAITVSKNCTLATGNFLQLGNLSKIITAQANSELGAGTNASTGLVITANGSTMTSGNNIITALTQPTSSTAGTSQFGINLRANTVPNTGANPLGPGTITPTNDYNIPNRYKFQNGDVVASSTGPTDFTTLTVSYIVNISPSQPIGVYDTTITYICTASF